MAIHFTNFEDVYDILPEHSKTHIQDDIGAPLPSSSLIPRIVAFSVIAFAFLGGLYLVLASKGILPHNLNVIGHSYNLAAQIGGYGLLGISTTALLLASLITYLLDRREKHANEGRRATYLNSLEGQIDSQLPNFLDAGQIFIKVGNCNGESQCDIYMSREDAHTNHTSTRALFAIRPDENLESQLRHIVSTNYAGKTVLTKKELEAQIKARVPKSS